MNTPHTPSAEELLHAWIDGELSADHEQQFYGMLASDAEYRSKLRQLRTIRAQALSFGTQSLPPAAMSEQLFNRLGLARYGQERPRAIILPLLSSAWSPIASAAAAAFITAVILLGLRQSPGSNTDLDLAANTNARETQRVESINPAPPQAYTFSESSPVSDGTSRFTDAEPLGPVASIEASAAPNTVAPSTENADESTEITPATDQFAAQLPTDPDAFAPTGHPDAASDALPDTPVVRTPPAFPDPADVSAVERPSAVNASRTVMGLQDGFIVYPAQDQLTAPGLLTLEIRGVTATSFPQATIPANPAPWMENMAVALFYTDEQSDYGVEYGQEAFSQHYSGIENGKYVRYEQNLRSSWLVATLRYRLKPLQSFAGIEPYASVGAGGTFELWPLVKGGFGLMYMPDRRVRFHAGIEGALMAYPYQQRWFTSKRAGLTYGLSVLF